MPITRREFDAGSRNPGDHLLEFLKANDQIALAIDELLNELLDKGFVVSMEQVQEVMSDLVNRGRAESKIVSGKIYYAYRKSFGFLPRRG